MTPLATSDFRGTLVVDGVELHVDHLIGEGTPLVLCNGIGANLELLDPFIEALAAQQGRRIPIIRFDVPGTGGSPMARCLPRMRGLARLVRDLVLELGYDQADVLGISWGGALAQEIALREFELCRRVVLCATSMGVVMVPARPSVLLTLASPLRHFRPSRIRETGARIYGGGFGDNSELTARFAESSRAPNPFGYYAQMFAACGWTSAHRLPRLRQPALIIAGDDDPIIPLVNVRIMAALLREASTHVVRGGGHLALLTHPDHLAPLIHEFVTDGEAVLAGRES